MIWSSMIYHNIYALYVLYDDNQIMSENNDFSVISYQNFVRHWPIQVMKSFQVWEILD